MKILFADTFPAEAIPAVAALGYEIDLRPELTAEDLPTALGEADVLVVRSTKVTAEAIAAAGPLGLILRAGAGTNTIDTKAAAARGIFVANVPGKNAIAVAELTLGLIISLDRRIPDNVADTRAGAWKKKEYGNAQGLAGRTLGIVGLGRIGLAVAQRAAAFGMPIITTAKDRDPETDRSMKAIGVTTVPDLAALAASSDIITLHVPAAASTVGLIGSEFLSNVKAGAWIINTSRADVIDEGALLEAIESKALRAAIDVFAGEPTVGEGDFVSVLAQHPAVYTTHHIGASTEQAQRAVADGVVAVLASFVRGAMSNVVNLTPPEPVGAILIVRHLDRVGVLSAVLEAVREAGLNIQEMTNQPFVGAGAAVALIHVIGDLPEDLRSRLMSVEHVIHCSVRDVS